MAWQCKKCGMIMHTSFPEDQGCPVGVNGKHHWVVIHPEQPKIIIQEAQPDYNELAAAIKRNERMQAQAELDAQEKAKTAAEMKPYWDKIESDRLHRFNQYIVSDQTFVGNLESMVKNAQRGDFSRTFKQAALEIQKYVSQTFQQYVDSDKRVGEGYSYDIFNASLHSMFQQLTNAEKEKGLSTYDPSNDYQILLENLNAANILRSEYPEDADIREISMDNQKTSDFYLEKITKIKDSLPDELLEVYAGSSKMEYQEFIKNYPTILKNYHALLQEKLSKVMEYYSFNIGEALYHAHATACKALKKGYKYDELTSAYISFSVDFKTSCIYWIRLMREYLALRLASYNEMMQYFASRIQKSKEEIEEQDGRIKENNEYDSYKASKQNKERNAAIAIVVARYAIIVVLSWITLLKPEIALLTLLAVIGSSVAYHLILREKYDIWYNESPGLAVFPAISAVWWSFLLVIIAPLSDSIIGIGTFIYLLLIGFMCLKIYFVNRTFK
ncbi:MAG: hypothetical protein WCR13_06290 [Sphaerochaeta sp.]